MGEGRQARPAQVKGFSSGIGIRDMEISPYYLLAIVVIITLYFADRDRRNTKNISLISSTAEKILSKIENVDDINDKISVIELHNETIIEVFTRINRFEEMVYFKNHYFYIMKLKRLRYEGKSEEDIIKKFMKYDNESYGGGDSVPTVNPKTNEKEIILFSPYYIATQGISFHEAFEFQLENSDFTEIGIPYSEKHANPEIPRRLMPVYYENEFGDIIEYP